MLDARLTTTLLLSHGVRHTRNRWRISVSPGSSLKNPWKLPDDPDPDLDPHPDSDLDPDPDRVLDPDTDSDLDPDSDPGPDRDPALTFKGEPCCRQPVLPATAGHV